jgi:peroxiredoxin Q/BCP
VRELREFRAHQDEYEANGVAVAGVTRDTPESNLEWSRRLELSYPLLSDREGVAARALGVTRRIGIGDWGVEFFRRVTFLIGRDGLVAAVWHRVKVRGHAREVLEMAKVLERAGD